MFFFGVRSNFAKLCHNCGVRNNSEGQHEPDSAPATKLELPFAPSESDKAKPKSNLADLCGVSLTFISNLENGKPTAELAKALTVLITLGLDVYLAKRGE